MSKKIDFETWKLEFQPVLYEDSGAQCFDHEECECEFLYTFELSEVQEDHQDAIHENRVWSWKEDGTIVTGILSERADLLITAQSFTESMEVK